MLIDSRRLAAATPRARRHHRHPTFELSAVFSKQTQLDATRRNTTENRHKMATPDPQDGDNRLESMLKRLKRSIINDCFSPVLQDFTGLPSFVARSDGRWTVVDGKLQQRLGLVEGRSERLWQSQDLERALDGGEEASTSGEGLSNHTSPAQPPLDEQQDDDYDLYSAFGKREIDRLKAVPPGEPWLQHESGEPFVWRPDEKGTPIQGIQQRFRASLLDVAKNTSGATNEKTLVPYLLFSRYSPLALSDMPPIRPKADWEYADEDESPELSYCEAFEDLLQTTRGDPFVDQWLSMGRNLLSSWTDVGLFSRGPRGGFPTEGSFGKVTTADLGMAWMVMLGQKGLLSQNSHFFHQGSVDPGLGPAALFKPSVAWLTLVNYMGKVYERQLPRTEQDLYDQFLAEGRRQSGDEGGVGGTLVEVLSSLATAGRALSDVFKEFGLENMNSPSRRTTSTSTQTESRGLPEPTSSDESSETFQRTSDGVTEETVVKKEPTATPDMSRDREATISTMTSTEQRTMEDGSVKITTVAEKVFGNGTKQVTKTTQIRPPSQSAAELSTSDGSQVVSQIEESRENDKGDSDSSRKGWFWK